jgi:hypothetical protein
VLLACTSCRPMMTLTLGAFETCAHALGTYGTSYTGRSARLFFMLEARCPQETTGRVAAQNLPSREAASGGVGHVALYSPPSGSGAMVHVASSEPFSSGRWVPEPLDMWQRVGARSTPCLDLKLVRRGTWSIGYQQWLSGPPRERL